MNIRKSILLRVRFAFLVISILGIAILGKIVNLQFFEDQKWAKLAEEISLQFKKVRATRGNIYSDNGSLLATSLPEYRLAFDPSVADEDIFNRGIDSLSILLHRHFGDRSASAYKRKITNSRIEGRQYIILNKELIKYQHKKLMAEWPIFREGRLRGGVIFEKVDRRFRPFKYLASRTIGYVNQNQYGAGLEYSFNNVLSGKDGKALFQKMAGGNWKPVYDGSEIRPQDGLDIVTTIDVNIQDVAESALLHALKAHKADYGSVVVMEVNTGAIKAISNLSKNPRGYYAERYNYAVGGQGLTEPGSTFKLVSMIALLEDSNINLNDTIDTGEGRFLFYDRAMVDHKYGGFGKVTVREAFEKSSNIAISKMINNHFGLEPARFIKYIDKLGLTQPLGFQMVGEGIPYIKTPQDQSWSGTTLPWMSIGYELKLTPLQILTLYNAVANDGKMIQPIIVQKTKRADKTYKNFQPAVLNDHICSEETLEKVKSLLKGVVENGTASNIKNTHYKIAGKTGTAQKIKEGGGYTRNYYTSFVGYFPADQPKYSCIVVIDNPTSYNQYGSDVAAPVFKTIADKIYSLDIAIHKSYAFLDKKNGVFPVVQAGLQDDLYTVCKQLGIQQKQKTEHEWVRAAIAQESLAWNGIQVQSETIPDVQGMRLRDALYLLENNGYKVIAEGTGRVVKQSATPGQKASNGTTVKLNLQEWPY